MPKKKINLEYEDIRNSYGDLNQSHPFEFFLGIGNKSFAFKSNNQAKLFLAKFEKSYNNIYSQFIDHFSKLFELNVNTITYKKDFTSSNFRDSLNFYLDRYDTFVNTDTIVTNPTRELENVYIEVLEQYKAFIKVLSLSNRSSFLLNRTYTDYQNAKRLVKDYEILISDTKGLKLVTAKELIQLKKYNFLKIA